MIWLLIAYLAWGYIQALELLRFSAGPPNEPLSVVGPWVIFALLFAGVRDTLRLVDWAYGQMTAKEPTP